jgi:hypothetical protein
MTVTGRHDLPLTTQCLGLARRILKAADDRLRGERPAALRTAPNRKLHQRIRRNRSRSLASS